MSLKDFLNKAANLKYREQICYARLENALMITAAKLDKPVYLEQIGVDLRGVDALFDFADEGEIHRVQFKSRSEPGGITKWEVWRQLLSCKANGLDFFGFEIGATNVGYEGAVILTELHFAPDGESIQEYRYYYTDIWVLYLFRLGFRIGRKARPEQKAKLVLEKLNEGTTNARDTWVWKTLFLPLVDVTALAGILERGEDVLSGWRITLRQLAPLGHPEQSPLWPNVEWVDLPPHQQNLVIQAAEKLNPSVVGGFGR
jgi:hypothetical protein